MMYFLHTGRQLSFASSVHHMHLCAQTECCSGSIHGNVSAAYNCYLLAQVDWRIVIITEGLHQVASGQILVGREYTVGVLTWNSHELGKSCAGTDEYGLKAFLIHQLVYGHGFTDDNIGLNLNAQFPYIVDFRLYHAGLWKTEFRNSICKHAAWLMKGFKNSYFISHLCKVACAGKSCRAGTDYSNLDAVGFLWLSRYESIFPGPVCHETLQLSDGNRLAFDAADTFAFALALLRAYPSAYCGKGAGFCYGICCILKFSFFYFCNELWYIDGNRASLDTFCILTVNAAGSFFLGFFLVISQTYFLKIRCPLLWVLFPYGYLL